MTEPVTRDACDVMSVSPTYTRALATYLSHVTHVTTAETREIQR